MVYVALEAENAAMELPWLCAGRMDGLPASCNIGSNTDRDLHDKVAPRAIVFFPKATDAEVERVLGEIRGQPGAIEVQPLRLTKEDVGRTETYLVEEEDIVRLAARVGERLDELLY